MPEMAGMSLEEQAGVATAIKKLAERRFTKFEKDVEEIIGRTYYDEEDFKKVKDMKKHTDEYTEIIRRADAQENQTRRRRR